MGLNVGDIVMITNVDIVELNRNSPFKVVHTSPCANSDRFIEIENEFEQVIIDKQHVSLIK